MIGFIKWFGNTYIYPRFLIELKNERVKHLLRKTQDGPPPFSWKMPNKMTHFLRGSSQTHKFHGFKSIDDAHSRVMQNIRYQDLKGFSASVEVGRRGSGAFVTVTKTTSEYHFMVGEYTKDKSELIELKRRFGRA